MAKNWISGVIKHPGALHKQLGVAADEKIPAKKMASARAGNYGATAASRANLAKTLAKFDDSRPGHVIEDGWYHLQKGEKVSPAQPEGEIRRCESPNDLMKRRGY